MSEGRLSISHVIPQKSILSVRWYLAITHVLPFKVLINQMVYMCMQVFYIWIKLSPVIWKIVAVMGVLVLVVFCLGGGRRIPTEPENVEKNS